MTRFALGSRIARYVAAAAAICALAATPALAQQGRAFTVQVDGSSTVFPLSEAIAESFQQQTQGRVRVTVGESGTGGGFRKFCRGETQVTGASRPILAREMEVCRLAGISYVEVPIAFDGLTVVVHPSNPIRSITVAQLRQIWQPSATGRITNWRQVNAAWPDMPLALFGAGTASGTFDYFTEAVVGTARSSRTDYTPTEDDNVTVQGVAANRGGMGYFGIAYLAENRSRLRALAIDNGNGPIEPSPETVANGTYQPLSRPIFLYFNAAALQRPQVLQFARYAVENGGRHAQQVGYIPLPASAYQTLLARVQSRTAGTAFNGRQEIGATIGEVLSRPLGVQATR